MNKFERAFNDAHEFRFDKFKFDEPDYMMLVIQDENDYFEHAKIQAAGLAYYTALARQANRDYDQFKRKLDFRLVEMYRESSNYLVERGRKSTVKDIDAQTQIRYEKELNELYDHLDELRSRKDYIEAFLEGWKQKGYQLSDTSKQIISGFITPKESITEEDRQNHINMAKEILSKRRQKQESQFEKL